MKENTPLTDDQFQEETGVDLASLVSSRLVDLADQTAVLYTQGYDSLASLLREEGLQLASAYDDGSTFFYVNDLSLL